jgi:histidyl-tRNA synthetase
MKKANLQPLKGFRDFYPEQMKFRNFLFGKMREISKLFGYQEYEGPVLESLDLYGAKSGEELVKNQTFILKDRGGRRLALRPELTPTMARMVAAQRQKLTLPLRWFSLGPRWRYEQPQKGRFREFWQWDVDLIGFDSPEADAEVISLACELFKSVGLSSKEVVIKINNRRFLENKLVFVEIPRKKIPEVFRAIDKKEKMTQDGWEKYLKEIGLNDLQIRGLGEILKDKDFANESEELTELFSTLNDLGVSKYIEFDPMVVRGLDYYTGTVFEAKDRRGEFRTILGGGRYDNLLEIIGGQKIPGVGFAAGDAVLEEILKKFKKIPKLTPCSTKVLVTVFDESFYRNSLKITSQLRAKNIPTEIYLDSQTKLDKQLKYADKKGICWVVIIGPEEEKSGTVTVKNMEKGSQETIPQEKLEDYFNN